MDEARRNEYKICWRLFRPNGPKCGKPIWGWSNRGEPLCRACFRERNFLQHLMILWWNVDWRSLVWLGRLDKNGNDVWELHDREAR